MMIESLPPPPKPVVVANLYVPPVHAINVCPDTDIENFGGDASYNGERITYICPNDEQHLMQNTTMHKNIMQCCIDCTIGFYDCLCITVDCFSWCVECCTYSIFTIFIIIMIISSIATIITISTN